MVREVRAPAESFWEDGYEDEKDCERFLQTRKQGAGMEDADASDEDDESEVEDETEEVVAEDESEDDIDETDDEEEDAEVVAEAENDDEDPPTEDDESEEAEPEDLKMATKTRKTRAGGKTKAEAIREVIERRQTSGDSLRPKDIIDELARKGFEVNASQVSVTLRNMGVPAAPRGRRPGTKMAKPAEVASSDGKSRQAMKRAAPPSDDGALSLSEGLDAAAEFADAVGGYDRATELLDACRRMRERD